MKLSNTQQEAFDSYKNGNNVFLTGPGGTGKTALIKTIYEDSLKKCKNIQLTALTGVASVQLHEKAKTIHSWAGVGLGDKNLTYYKNKIAKSKATVLKWKSVEVLVIDEVSMLTEELLELLNSLAQYFRKNTKIFGGIQLILSGDFYQLPPVKNNSKFCFESRLFEELFQSKIVLDTIFRQEDSRLVKILNNIRLGKITKGDINILNTRLRVDVSSDIKPVILMPRKNSVEEINNQKLNSLPGESHIFNRKIHEDLEISNEEKSYMKLLSASEYTEEYGFLEKSTLVTEALSLKVGAQVMCTINVLEEDTLKLSNGTQGIVTEFRNDLPVVEFENGLTRLMNYHTWKSHTIPCCGLSQIPLILSWALTIHKAQGTTLSHCRMNIGNDIFEAGQTYVALSRVKNLEGIYLEEFNPHKIKINPKVKQFYESI